MMALEADSFRDALDSLKEITIGDGGDTSEEEVEASEIDDEPAIRLRTGLDTEKLMGADKEGVEFEIVPEGVPSESGTSTDMDSSYFDSENYKFSTMAALGGEGDGEEEEDEYKDLSPFQKYVKKFNFDDISPEKDGKIMKRVLQDGTGGIVSESALVRMNYSATVEYADTPFDCTELQDRPFSFKLGNKEGVEVIPGLDIAVSTMKKGEVAHFVIYPEYAYGPRGCPPRIPENAIILFHVHLLQAIEHAGVDEFFSLPRKAQQDVSFRDMMKVIRAEREVGNDMYRRKQYIAALKRYKRAVRVLENRRLADEEEEKIHQKNLVKLYMNIAQVHLIQSNWARCVSFSSRALAIDRKCKGLYKMGKALRKLHEFDRARFWLKAANKQFPNNTDIAKELKELDKDIKKFAAVEKVLYQRMFKPSGANTDTCRTTEEQKENVAEQNGKTEEARMTCTEEFKKIINQNLQDFVDDRESIEMPFPASRFNITELAYIGNTAKSLNLDVQYRGEGSSLQIRIRKRT